MKKKCIKCSVIKTKAEFTIDKRMRNEMGSVCRVCSSIYNRKWRKEPKQIRYIKQWNSNNRDKINKSIKEYKGKNPLKSQAHSIVQWAIKKGRLTKMPCLICDDTQSEAHHEDYSLPLDVLWLCKKHHKERHRKYK